MPDQRPVMKSATGCQAALMVANGEKDASAVNPSITHPTKVPTARIGNVSTVKAVLNTLPITDPRDWPEADRLLNASVESVTGASKAPTQPTTRLTPSAMKPNTEATACPIGASGASDVARLVIAGCIADRMPSNTPPT